MKMRYWCDSWSLQNISDVVGYKKVDGEKVDDYGTLYYHEYQCKRILSRMEKVVVSSMKKFAS